MKKGLLIVGAVLATLVIAVLVVPSFFNWNSQKDRIEAAATEALRQPVDIRGDIALSILPTPRLKAEGLTVGSRDTLADGPFISAGLIDVRVAFLPILSGKVEASRVVLENADIVLLTGQKGDPEADQVQEADTQSDTPEIALPAVDIRNAKITLLDAMTNEETSLSEIDLLVSAKSTSGPFSVEGGLRYKDVPLTLSLQTGNIDAADFPIELRVESEGDGSFVANLAGSASDLIGPAPRAEGRMTLTAADAGKTLEALTGDANPSLAGQALNIAAPFRYAGQSFNANGVKMALGEMQLDASAAADMAANPMTLQIEATSGRLDISPFLAKPEPNAPLMDAIELELPTDMDVAFNARIETLAGLPVTLERVDLSARLQNGRLELRDASALLPGGVTATANGNFQTPQGILVGKVGAAVKGGNAHKMLQAFMGPQAALPPSPTPIDITLDVALEQRDLRLAAVTGALGAMRINGSGKVGYGANPAVDITAKINQVTLDDWTGGAAETAAADNQQPFDGTVRFNIGIDRVLSADQTYAGLTAKGSLKNDTLSIQSLTLGQPSAAYVDIGGSIANATGAQPRLDLRYKASAPNANQLLVLGNMEPIELADGAGAVDVTGTIKGSPAAPQVEASGTLGGATLQAFAALKGLDTDAPASKGTATFSHPNLVAYAAQLGMMDGGSVGKQAQPTTIKSSFDVAGTRSKVAMTIDNPQGSMSLDMGNEGETYAAVLKAKAGSLTQYLRALGMVFDPAGARLGGLDVDFDLGGPLSNLKINTLRADVGPAKLTGSGSINAAGDVTQIDLRLVGKNLDLQEILPEPETGAKQAATGKGERWSKEPLELEALESVDGKITLDLDRLTLTGYELKNARLSLTSQGKSLRVALDKGTLFDGPTTLAIALNAEGVPRLSVDVSVQQGNIALASQSSAAIQPLTGTFDLNGSFSGVGASGYDIVKSLKGTAAFSARDGVINGVDIVQVNERFGNLSTINDFVRIIGGALRGGQTAYRLIAVDAVAKDGVIRTQNMRTDIDGGAKASLTSAINLPAWNIAANGAFSLEDHPDAPPVGVSIKGPLDNPEIVYQTKKLQEYVGVRLGAAVLKGIVKGEGFGLGDLIGGSKQQTQDPNQPTEPDEVAPSQIAPEDTQPAPSKKPEEQIRDLILEGLFGKRTKSP